MVPNAALKWSHIFQAFGLTAYPVEAGCCGMSGPYGHLGEHQQHSSDLYHMSWASKIRESENHRVQPLITGFSCRCQVDRYEPKNTARHPIEILYQAVTESQQVGHHRSMFAGEGLLTQTNQEAPSYV
jgi:Fe-S oxidoreductase